ncbi:MAG TPA: Hsp20/alpha crystallin family protein [Candidatus Limnocylindrales bacterium]|nr:Hsp20/alpha crystallin family protein [Candidatus Limnocylindrales bacterium]
MLVRRPPFRRAGAFEDLTGFRPEIDWLPDLDIYETEAEFILIVSLPGVSSQDLEVAVRGRSLTVSGRRVMTLPREVTVHLVESQGGRFERRIGVPPDADLSQIRTTIGDGQLVIRLPRRVSREIEITLEGSAGS